MRPSMYSERRKEGATKHTLLWRSSLAALAILAAVVVGSRRISISLGPAIASKDRPPGVMRIADGSELGTHASRAARKHPAPGEVEAPKGTVVPEEEEPVVPHHVHWELDEASEPALPVVPSPPQVSPWDQPRTLPDPRGPEDGESVPQYIGRLLGTICSLDRDRAQFDRAEADQRTSLELELEAYLRSHSEAVDTLSELARSATDVRVAEVALILLGRCSHRNAVDFLTRVAQGLVDFRSASSSSAGLNGSGGSETPDARRRLSVAAVEALLQGGGKAGPRAGWGGGDRVLAGETSVDDPHIYSRLVELLRDAGTPRDARLAILRGMRLNLPDPRRRDGGEFPRPACVATLAQAALSLVSELATCRGDSKIADAARFALATSHGPGVATRLLEIARNEGDDVLRARTVEALGQFGADAGVRDFLIDQLQNSPSELVRHNVICGLPSARLLDDPRLLQAVLDRVHDQEWPVQVEAIHTLIRTGDRDVVGRCLGAMHAMPLESIEGTLRKEMQETATQLAQDRSAAEEIRQSAERIVARLTR